jgi:hypothetical protein
MDDDGASWPDEQSLERILDWAPGKASGVLRLPVGMPVLAPGCLDKKALRRDLAAANRMFMGAMSQRLLPKALRQRQSYEKALRKARHLAGRKSQHGRVLDSLIADLDALTKGEKRNARLRAVFGKMAEMRLATEATAKSQPEVAPASLLAGLSAIEEKPRRTLGPDDISACEWMAGVLLPEVFEKHFVIRATGYHDGCKVRGVSIGVQI